MKEQLVKVIEKYMTAIGYEFQLLFFTLVGFASVSLFGVVTQSIIWDIQQQGSLTHDTIMLIRDFQDFISVFILYLSGFGLICSILYESIKLLFRIAKLSIQSKKIRQ